MFVYLHGFNSSPESFKARALAQRLRERGRAHDFVAPSLSHHPRDAIATAEALLKGHAAASLTLVGSSLGGHYATWLAERYGVRAVLVNPAIHPAVLLAGALGPQRNLYSGAHYELTPEHLQALRALDVEAITRPERYLLVVASGDEVLDSRIALARFAAARCIVHAGGDHGFADFSRYLDAVIDFGLG
ncbi:MAG: alpha/beta fold hydrolase [Burkholderiales bacterium]|nr:alpha/beta fold hydrolase [Burkholderiales bacterium]